MYIILAFPVGMEEPLTVTQLNTRVKDVLGQSPGLREIWVSGEISNLKKYPSGHYYFTLKDSGSQIRAVLFAGSRLRVNFEPRDSMKVSAFGRVDIYVPNGGYQFIAETMRQSGIGDLYLEYEKLKRRLEAEGMFSESRKRPLPKYPRRIGVVTSEAGAVIHDIITTSATRFPADILLVPAQVQGEGSAATVVRGIEMLNRVGVDVIIVGRGGGSIEDLWTFNEESVARAIAASRIPVVSAVGHETDFTIADFVADRRAPTPTGAAAIVLRDVPDIKADIDNMAYRAGRALSQAIGESRGRLEIASAKVSPRRALDDIGNATIRLDDLFARAGRGPRDALAEMRRRYEAASYRLTPERSLERMGALKSRVESLSSSASREADHALSASKSRLSAAYPRADRAVSASLAKARGDLESLSKRMEGLNPENVLGRGYAMVTSGDGRVLVSAGGIEEGDDLVVHLRDGTLGTKVTKKEMKG